MLPVNKRNFKAVNHMLRDVSNIQIVSHGSKLRALQIESHAKLLEKFGHDLILLGKYREDFYSDKSKRFDEIFYDQAKISFDRYWDSFYIHRNYEKEEELYNLLVCGNPEYIFVHDNSSKDFTINEKLLPRGIPVIRPDLRLAKRFNFSDYSTIIERASEIHCMESSFAALVESLKIDVPKFAHRYARPETRNNVHFESTYRSFRTILN